MGSLIYLNSGLENSPYSSYLGIDLWEEIEDEFTKNACKLMGLPVECPLDVWYYLKKILILKFFNIW